VNTDTTTTQQDGDAWIGWIEEIPGVNCQETTREELPATLEITLEEAVSFSLKVVPPAT